MACIVALLSLSSPALAVDAPSAGKETDEGLSSAEIKTKSEVVYGVLNADGAVKNVYTVNRLELGSDGSFTDYGTYSTLTNLTNTAILEAHGNAITGSGEAGDFYYQGTMENINLPWIFNLSYTMDGTPIDAASLAGNSGALEIQLATKRNTDVNAVFYNNYMLQITFTLDMNLCHNITAAMGTVSEAGSSKIVTFTVFPGKDANISLTANVENFSMAGIDIAAVPYNANMEMPDTSILTERFSQLHEGISQLHDGVGEMVDGSQDLNGGGAELQKGSAFVKDGLAQLADNGGSILTGSSNIQDALEKISAGLEEGLSQNTELSSIEQLPAGLSAIAGGLRQVGQGLDALKGGFSPAYDALDAAMADIPTPALSDKEIAALYLQLDPGQHSVLDTLVDTYTAAQTAKGTYTQVKAAFNAVTDTLTSVSAELSTIADSLDTISAEAAGIPTMLSQMKELAAGLSSLSDQYAAFHTGLKKYTDGVKNISVGYTDFDEGLSSVAEGISALQNGLQALHQGTSVLNEKTAGMAGEAENSINAMMADYLGNDFAMESFTSDKNTEVSFVQFVLKTDGIFREKEASPDTPEEKEETFLDRFLALFKKED